MALEIAFYKVTKDVAIRSGLIELRYRTIDKKYILDNKDLSRIRLSADEFLTGLQGIERVPESEVETLIAEGGYKFGYDGLDEEEETELTAMEETSDESDKVEESVDEQQEVVDEQEEQEENKNLEEE